MAANLPPLPSHIMPTRADISPSCAFKIMPESLLGNLVSSLEELSRHRDWRHRAVSSHQIDALHMNRFS
jgi:hypothetical protein